MAGWGVVVNLTARTVSGSIVRKRGEQLIAWSGSAAAGYGRPVIYQHPLAYLLGVEGLALLRAWAGDYDEAFVQARLAEVRRLLDEPVLADHPGVAVRRGDLPGAYRGWSVTYDELRNSLFDSDEPVMHEILEALPAGTEI